MCPHYTIRALLHGTVQGDGKQHLDIVHLPLSTGAFSVNWGILQILFYTSLQMITALSGCRLGLLRCLRAGCLGKTCCWRGPCAALGSSSSRSSSTSCRPGLSLTSLRASSTSRASPRRPTLSRSGLNHSCRNSECCLQEGFSKTLPFMALMHKVYITFWALCESDLALVCRRQADQCCNCSLDAAICSY